MCCAKLTPPRLHNKQNTSQTKKKTHEPHHPGSFLVNTALILLMSSAVIQFCATAFGAYAGGTAVFEVFGNQVRCAVRVLCACCTRAVL